MIILERKSIVFILRCVSNVLINYAMIPISLQLLLFYLRNLPIEIV